MDVYNQLTGATALVLTAISFVALMIRRHWRDGISCWYLSQNERKRSELQAVGATKVNILSQFLIEAVVLTALGGPAGLAVGEISSYFVNKYSPRLLTSHSGAIAVGIGVSAAWNRLRPMRPPGKSGAPRPGIEALRWE